MTILEPKKEKEIFLKIYFFSKMLNFQDFSKFSKILKFAVQYLCRDISNVKIGLYLRSSHKKEWKTHFWPYSLKKSKKSKNYWLHKTQIKIYVPGSSFFNFFVTQIFFSIFCNFLKNKIWFSEKIMRLYNRFHSPPGAIFLTFRNFP